MKDEINKNECNDNKIEFNPDLKKNNSDISIDLIDFHFDEKEILKVYDIHDEWDNFFSEKEYQTLLEEYLDIKKTNINAVFSNPLYFIKKIIYFYNKETFVDSFLLKLKSPPVNKKIQKINTAKSISFKTKLDNESKKTFVNMNSNNKIFSGTIKPNNKPSSISFNLDNKNNIIIPINNYDENKKEIQLSLKFIEKNPKKFNNKRNFDKIDIENNNKDEFSLGQNLNEHKNQNKGSNSNSIYSSSLIKKNNYFSELLSIDNAFISYDKKENENFKILIRENNDNLLNIFQREKLEGTTYESIANKTFELICNNSINRNIEVKNYIIKKAKKINTFFNLNKENKIKEFQIDSYISKLTGKELKQIKEKFPNNFFFFENLNLKDSENYEVIGEISQNIINNSRQKIAQEFN